MRSLSLHYTFLWMDVGISESNIKKQFRQYKSLHTRLCCGRAGNFLRSQPIRGILVLSSAVTLWTRRAFSFHRKHNLSARYEPPLPQTSGRADLVPPPPPPGVINLLASHFSGSPPTIISIAHPPCQFPLSHHSQSFFFPFLLLAGVSGTVPVAVTSLGWWQRLSRLPVTVWCLGTLTSWPGSSSPSGLWGERPGCEPSTPTSIFPSAVDTEDTKCSVFIKLCRCDELISWWFAH